MTTATTPTTEAEAAIQEHREWMRIWYELNAIASSGFTARGEQLPMTAEARDAARTLPDVLDRLEECWLQMDETVRPAHYLMNV